MHGFPVAARAVIVRWVRCLDLESPQVNVPMLGRQVAASFTHAASISLASRERHIATVDRPTAEPRRPRCRTTSSEPSIC